MVYTLIAKLLCFFNIKVPSIKDKSLGVVWLHKLNPIDCECDDECACDCDYNCDWDFDDDNKV